MKYLCSTIYASVTAAVLICMSASVLAGPDPDPSWDNKINTPKRFKVLGNFNSEAVLDRETGLVWELSPDTSFYFFVDARNHCDSLVIGDRMGWRLPKVNELTSPVDPNTVDSLPADHPFVGVQGTYWSGSLHSTGFGFVSARTVRFPIITPLLSGNIDPNSDVKARVWCVRAPGGAIDSSEQ